MTNWPVLISKVIYHKQIAAEHDKKGILPWHLPRVAAPLATIEKIEITSGIVLSKEYKEFLAHADGWPGFHITTDLFGSDDFAKGRHRRAIQTRPGISQLLAEQGINIERVCAIGASDEDIDAFVLVSSDGGPLAGRVLWLATQEVDRYEGFKDFFLAMIEYNARIAKRMKEKSR